MRCGVKYKSFNKGQDCKDYMSCDVTLEGYKKEGRKADCGCSPDDTGYPRCGIMNGDYEFDEYRTSFIGYFARTKYCHVSRGFDFDCGSKKTFNKLYFSQFVISKVNVHKQK